MNKLVLNERAKLSATYLNGIGIALFAVGSLAPIVSVINGSTQQVWPVVVLVLCCAVLSVVLHLGARWTLRGLVE